jgi:hypothetical protein
MTKTIEDILEAFYVQGIGRVATELSKSDEGVIDFQEDIDKILSEIEELLVKKIKEEDICKTDLYEYGIHTGWNACCDEMQKKVRKGG